MLYHVDLAHRAAAGQGGRRMSCLAHGLIQLCCTNPFSLSCPCLSGWKEDQNEMMYKKGFANCTGSHSRKLAPSLHSLIPCLLFLFTADFTPSVCLLLLICACLSAWMPIFLPFLKVHHFHEVSAMYVCTHSFLSLLWAPLSSWLMLHASAWCPMLVFSFQIGYEFHDKLSVFWKGMGGESTILKRTFHA